MRILITGASGSGTSTLASALAEHLKIACLDGDNYFWLRPEPPFVEKRSASERLTLLTKDLQAAKDAVLAGSVMGWGQEIENAFDLVVFLFLDTDIRLERLKSREIQRFGTANPAFLEWAAGYDAGTLDGRSLAKHRAWLATRKCPVLEIRGDLTVEERLTCVLQNMPKLVALKPPNSHE